MSKVFKVLENDIPVTVGVRTRIDGVTVDEIELSQPPSRYPSEGERDDVIVLSVLQAYRLAIYILDQIEKENE